MAGSNTQQINLDDYQYRIEHSYIIYHKGHWYEDLDTAISFFDKKFEANKLDMEARAMQTQINAKVKQLKVSGQKATPGLAIYQNMPWLIEEMMDIIASTINDGIYLQASQIGFDDILKAVAPFSRALQNGYMNAQQVNNFFELIIKGIEMAGKFDVEIFDGLTGLGKLLTGDSNYSLGKGNNALFRSSNSNLDLQSMYQNEQAIKKSAKPKKLNEDDFQMTQKILEYLENATVALKNNKGTLSQQSFVGTITNIFNKIIGERLAKTLILESRRQIVAITGNTILEGLQKLPGTVKLEYNPDSRYTLGGSKKDTLNRTVKTDIFNSKAFILTVTDLNGQTFKIEIGANTSVKWYKKLSDRGSVEVVQGTRLGYYFPANTEGRYLAYNTIAHSFSGPEGSKFHEAFRTFRAYMAATFFDQWLAGTGLGVRTAGGNLSKAYVNKAQFLMVNGKVYSILRIISNIQKELANKHSWYESEQMPFNIKVRGMKKTENNWIQKPGGRPYEPSKEIALMERSPHVNEILNKLEIAAHFNANILTKYAY